MIASFACLVTNSTQATAYQFGGVIMLQADEANLLTQTLVLVLSMFFTLCLGFLTHGRQNYFTAVFVNMFRKM